MKHLKNIKELVTMQGAHQKDGRSLLPEDLTIIKDASLIIDNSNKIVWCGYTKDLPTEYCATPSIDCSQYVITPEIVDSHTHSFWWQPSLRVYNEAKRSRLSRYC